jgi:UDP-N-acetylmuramoylalanine--D-glutamate ligase
MSNRVTVLGAGRSGIAIANAAKQRGAQVRLIDHKPLEAWPQEAQALEVEKVGNFDRLINTKYTDQLITSPGVDRRAPILKDAAASGVEVIGEIEFAFRIAKAPIIAITGTNGKSTSTVMTHQCLLAAQQNAILCGNIYGSGYDEVPLTEAAANSTSDQVLVAEISSFQLEWVTDFRPRCAGITNITPDHLNRYANFDEYAQTKRRIFDRMGTGDTIVANAGDTSTYPSNESLRDRGYGHPRVRFYGSAGVDASFDSQALKLSVSEPLENLPFAEKHNYQNACMSALLAISYLESIEAFDPSRRVELVLQGLKSFKGLAHRMQRLGSRDGILVINNSMCTNPAAVVASSSSLGMPQHLLVGGVAKNYKFDVVKTHLERTGHRAYLFGQDSAQILEDLGGNPPVFDTMEQAFRAATDSAKSGDAIMLAPGCASMDQFENFVQRGEVFEKIAREWLQNGTTT